MKYYRGKVSEPENIAVETIQNEIYKNIIREAK